ncbi:similar to Saccharomyces cerevisiae YPR026W ATH1 Acid trehalase required for utilization of extracellular trehalose [Maudiozyma barnettii]|uniref:alpha,alpha-trehalase n=1 Tax=Maudiozyma barnettii TaxID=61262 RepID=A0A8H2VBC6_9SACH|nr:alpha,alpha-trehalase ATH1 [Kazachstania barnettii]CAB4252142.1 similar to Saccharomyces cerevisiae YPR026W ATH1 Acid trehalase required for utilization of extracellular trehalose [Kazachstania barnettii]CAD1778701.1 similar to Saccharomyces cerevisiae YPR026W ATH1 Acid trehalase required for utilization of extracellular trehalose [Kazachstania barnettii]
MLNIFGLSKYNNNNNNYKLLVETNSNFFNTLRRYKFYFIVTFAMVLLLSSFLAALAIVPNSSSAQDTSNSKTEALPTSIVQDRTGVIKPAEDHELDYNNDNRLASKQFFELLQDTNNTYYNEETGILGTSFFSPNVFSRQPYVANGYIGSRIPNIGLGYAQDEITLFTNESAALNNDWPQFNPRYAGSFVADFYALEEHLTKTNFPELDDKGYPNIIASIPDWTDLQFKIAKTPLWFNALNVTADQVTNYSQNMSINNGIVNTTMDWLDGLLHVSSQIVSHRDIYQLGYVNLEVSLNTENLPANFTECPLELYDIFNHSTSWRTYLQDSGYDEKNDGIFMIVEPDNVPYNNAALFSTAEIELLSSTGDVTSNVCFTGTQSNSTDNIASQTAAVILTKENPKIIVRKYVGVMSTTFSLTNSSNLDTAISCANEYKGQYNRLLASHDTAWAELYGDAKIEIPSDSFLELAAKSSLFHLLANSRPNNVTQERGMLLPVSGLSSDSYGGLVFWDADMWMTPALLPFAPKVAKNINSYRNATHHQAQLNAREYGYAGAAYPWTSGGFSNCTSTGPCVDYEYHLNVDIAFSTLSIFLSGATEDLNEDYLRYTTWPLVKDAADFFTSFVRVNNQTGKYETLNSTDPDEYANHVDNGAFTNTGIKTLMKWATDIGHHLNEAVDSKWMVISNNIIIPRAESNITLEYTGMNSSVEIKQADVTLVVYPLDTIDDPISAAYAINDLYYYSGKQAASGPAMTYPVFVAAAQSLLNHGSSSQSYLYKAIVPYMRMPFAQFSEQSDDNYDTNGGLNPAFPFLTGNGGVLQSIVFGLTGIRYSYEVNNSTNQMDRFLKFDPTELGTLPQGLAIRGFQYMGNTIDFIIDETHGTVVNKQGNSSITIKVPNRDKFDDTDIHFYIPSNKTLQRRSSYCQVRIADDGIYYTIEPGQELVIPVYKPLLSVEGNLAEHRQITNLTSGVAGDVGLSAIDGNNYTHWQPVDKNNAKLLIDLGSEQQINKGFINWGYRPAQNLSISILPHSELLESLFTNVTYIIENSNGTKEDATAEAMAYLEHYMSSGNESTSGACSSDISDILNWKLGSFNNMIQSLPNIEPLQETFITIVDDQKVVPSLPYYSELDVTDAVVLVPSNITEFTVDYSKVNYNTSLSCLPGASSNDWKKARYVVVSVQGTYDNDAYPYGATLNEIILQS